MNGTEMLQHYEVEHSIHLQMSQSSQETPSVSCKSQNTNSCKDSFVVRDVGDRKLAMTSNQITCDYLTNRTWQKRKLQCKFESTFLSKKIMTEETFVSKKMTEDRGADQNNFESSQNNSNTNVKAPTEVFLRTDLVASSTDLGNEENSDSEKHDKAESNLHEQVLKYRVHSIADGQANGSRTDAERVTNGEKTFKEVDKRLPQSDMVETDINDENNISINNAEKVKSDSELDMNSNVRNSFEPILVKDKNNCNFLPSKGGINEIETKSHQMAIQEGETLSKELNMPDFYFILRIEQLGQLAGNKVSLSCSGREQFECIVCGEIVNWRRTLCRHMREEHGEILKSGQISHDKSLTSEKKGKVMKMSGYMKLEMGVKKIRNVEKQDLPGTFECKTCQKVFHRERFLKKHESVHEKSKEILCDICVKTFKTEAIFKQHMLKTHKRERGPYQCDKCDFTSSVNILIHEHRQIHPENSILCEICGNAYADKSTLMKHMRVHDLSRPYPCQFKDCTWRFHSEVMCKAHMEAHVNKGKFKCSECGYVFRKKHHLKRHEKVVHNIKDNGPASIEGNVPVNKDNKSDLHVEVPTLPSGYLIIDENIENQIVMNNAQYDIENTLQTTQIVITDESGEIQSTCIGDDNIVYQTFLTDNDVIGNNMGSRTVVQMNNNLSVNDRLLLGCSMQAESTCGLPVVTSGANSSYMLNTTREMLDIGAAKTDNRITDESFKVFSEENYTLPYLPAKEEDGVNIMQEHTKILVEPQTVEVIDTGDEVF
ncbi:zinc finger protein 701-like isoform X2 [Mya arenaria]|nr:zinc finger protein 701-like isoform X2 [Mya arenaria]